MSPPEIATSTPFALSWSGGKDSALALFVLRSQGAHVQTLITTVTDAYDRITGRGVRRDLLARRVDALNLPSSRS